MFEEFYSTFATVSLTVTGLWMYVAQARFREWIADRDHFRRASAVSVQLAFPGLMSLFALINSESTMLWRVVFGVMSAVATPAQPVPPRWTGAAGLALINSNEFIYVY